MDLAQIAAYLSAGVGMGLGAIGSAIGEGYGAGRALEGIARQPKARDALTRDMLIGQAISETPGIFALVISFVLIFSVKTSASWAYAAAILGAGVSIGLGALGPAIGSGVIAGRATAAVSRNPSRDGPAMRMMIIAQAFCQTTVVYALLISLLLWAIGPTFASDDIMLEITSAAALLGAGMCMGLGSLGPALGTGDVGAAAAEGVAVYPDSEGPMSRAFYMGAAVSQTTSIYALLVALMLIFFGRS
ncbi:MAG: ATP synthase F0 subunit C [Planctomycetota bacterium]